MSRIWEALWAASGHLADHAKYPLRVLVIVSDGTDNASTATPENLMARLSDDGTILYAISSTARSHG